MPSVTGFCIRPLLKVCRDEQLRVMKLQKEQKLRLPMLLVIRRAGAGKRDGGKRGAADRSQSRAKKTVCQNCEKNELYKELWEERALGKGLLGAEEGGSSGSARH